MKTPLFVSAFLFLGFLPFISAAPAARSVEVIVRHDLKAARPAEMIAIPLSELQRRLPGVASERLAVRRAGIAAPLASQVLPAPASTIAGGEFIFLVDFAEGEQETRFVVTAEANAIAPVASRVFARRVSERFDDFAFENDRLAHRVYGPALAAPAAGREQLTSSGVDVWCKRTGKLVIDAWYSSKDYHKDHGDGLDFYHVGKTRGCGGSGLWDGAELHPSGNWTAYRVLANGPLRTVFELDYAEWTAGGGVRVSEVKRFTIDAGRNLNRVDAVLTGATGPVGYALGLAKHPPTPAALSHDLAAGWLSQWENYAKPDQGGLGTAVLVAGGPARSVAQDAKNHLLVADAIPGRALTYYFGAGWARAGEFTDQAAWESYVRAFATRLSHPLKISFVQP